MDFRKTTIRVHLPKCSPITEQSNYNLSIDSSNYNPYSGCALSTIKPSRKHKLPPIYKKQAHLIREAHYHQTKLIFKNICNLSFDAKECYMKLHHSPKKSGNCLRSTSYRINDSTVYLAYCTNSLPQKSKIRSQSTNSFHDTMTQFGKKFESYYSIGKPLNKVHN